VFIGVPSTAAVGAAPALDGNVRPKLSVGQDNTHGRMALLPALHLPAGTVVWAMPSRRTTQSSHGETDRHVGPRRRRGVDSTDSTTLIRWHRSGGSGTSAQSRSSPWPWRLLLLGLLPMVVRRGAGRHISVQQACSFGRIFSIN